MASIGRRNGKDNSRAGFEKRQKRRQIRALQEAIDNHDAVVVKEILQDDFDVDFQYRSQTALQLAVKEGCYDICKLLIEKGASVNTADAENNNLLNMACWRGNKDIAQLLVNNGASVDEQNIQGQSPLHICAIRNNADILQILLNVTECPDISNLTGQSPLYVATSLEHVEIVLLIGGCDVDKGDEHRRTPLMIAAEKGFIEIVKILINAGAHVNNHDWTGSTPLFDAVKNGHIGVVRVLIEHSADLNLPTTKGISPLLEAIQQDFFDIAILLIDSGCDVCQTDRLQQAPIHSAVRKDSDCKTCKRNKYTPTDTCVHSSLKKVSQYFNEEIGQVMTLIRKLVDAGCDLNAPDQRGERPLYQSACGGNIELTEYLLNRNVDLTVTNCTGDTILHGGVHGNQPEIVDKLIKAGCALDIQNKAGEHPLLTAVIYHSEFQIIQSLVSAGSNLNLKDKTDANTALHNAILHYYSEAAQLLIDSGCDVNTLNAKRHSPLYVACEKNDDTVAQKILSHKKFSRKLFMIPSIPQPLYAAVGNNHVHLVDLLIKAGCNINMVNVDGLTPVMFAIQEKCPFVVKLLLKYNCDLEAHVKVRRLMKCCLLHEDRHPHFDLEPLFLALTHKDVEMLQLLIKCYWTVPIHTVTLLDTVFQSAEDLNTHYSPELKAEIGFLFKQCTSVPRTLEENCRSVIRASLGPCPADKVQKLPIASKLKDYVLMDEVFGDLDDNILQDEIRHPTDFRAFRTTDGEDEPFEFDLDEGARAEDFIL